MIYITMVTTKIKKGPALWPALSVRMSRKRILVKTLFDTSRLTSALTQVVQFSFTYSTTTFNSNAVNYRRVSLEDTLNAFAVGNFANSECRVQTAVTNSDNHALECLQTFLEPSTTHTFTSTVSPGRKEGTSCFICSCSSCLIMLLII